MISACMFVLTVSGNAQVLTRDGVIKSASLYANHDWLCSRKNASKAYNLLTSGRRYQGVSYNYGGFDTTDVFTRKVKKGVIAGNYRKRCGRKLCIRRDFAGIDCSGFVSRSLGISRCSSIRFSGISIRIPQENLQPGDILNAANRHVMLFHKFDDENQMWVYEATTWIRNKKSPPAGVIYRSVNVGSDYVPRRYYRFIGKGEMVKTNRTIAVVRQFGGKGKRLYIRLGTTGVITKGPVIRGKTGEACSPSDVWIYVKFSNDKEGWTTIRHLTLISPKTWE